MKLDTNEVKRVMDLRDETGAGLLECRKAIEFEKNHEGCTAIGFLKATSIAVATPTMKFEDRVRMFSTESEKQYERN